jgi:hypothetical protein
MSRYDKYNPVSGGFRAKLAAAITATSGPSSVTDLNRVICVALNNSGQVIKATSAVSCVGVIVATHAMAAGDVIDVMTHGEIVEMAGPDIEGGTAATAGKTLYWNTTASRLTATAPADGLAACRIGHIVEATRLVVRVEHLGADGA